MKKKTICHICFSEFPADQRVRRYVNELREKGFMVIVICIDDSDNKREDTCNPRVIRLKVSKKRGSYASRFSEYVFFFVKSFFVSVKVFLKYRPEVYHVHTFPDFIAFAPLLPKFFGSKVVLDMHELTPEAMMMREGYDEKKPLIRFLKFIEKISVGFADRVITIHEIAERILRGRNKKDFISIMNGVDRKEIISAEKKSDGFFNLIYNGTINPNLNLTMTIKAMSILKQNADEEEFSKIRFLIYGKGPDLENILEYAESLELKDKVIYKGNMDYTAMIADLAYASAAVYPPLPNIYTDICYPIKITEMINLKIPVISSRYKTLNHFYPEDCIFYFTPGDAGEMAERILEVMRNPQIVKEKTEKALERFSEYSWEKIMRGRYMNLIYELFPENSH